MNRRQGPGHTQRDSKQEMRPQGRRFFHLVSFVIVLLTGAMLVYGTLDMPPFGDPSAPANLHVVPRYIENGLAETGVINLVTAILASYRGYDTLGETVVIFTAGLSVILLLRRNGTGG